MKITALSIVAPGQKPWKTGDKLLAFFDVEYSGIRIRECLLVRASRGFLLAQAPRGVRPEEGRRLVDIVDPEIRKAMAASAHSVFLAMGGVEDVAA